jgi:hypothetical protein
MTGVWNQPAAERAARLRETAVRDGHPGAASAPDAELLNTAYEQVLREQIDTRDAYLRLLTELRHHDDRVRAGALAGIRPQIDRIARHLVREHHRPFEALLFRIGRLGDRPGAGELAALRSSADSVRHFLRAEGNAEDRIDPGDARHHLRTLRSVIAVLREREGVTAQDVLRLMDAALNQGPMLDLFDVGTPKPSALRTPLPFAGEGWHQAAVVWTYQPAPGSAAVKAYPLGDQWHLDLWSADGPLLATGTAGEDMVGPLAAELAARAPAWTADRCEYGWRRFEQAATTVAEQTARVSAANAASPGRADARPDATRPASPAPPGGSASAASVRRPH